MTMYDRTLVLGIVAALAGAGACTTEDDLERLESLEVEDLEQDIDALVDEDVEDRAEDEVPAAEGPDALTEPDDPAEVPGDVCTITDSNGPLDGGVTAIEGCDEGELCLPIACAGYSCFGYCQGGGSFPGGK